MPSLYEISVPSFISNLKILSSLLEKGLAAGKESVLLETKLIADMRGLVYQIQRVSDTAKGLAVRVGGIENVVWEDNETTFPDMQERIKKTIDFLEGVDPKSFEGKEDAEVVMKTQSGERKFKGQDYVIKFAIPNFYFHFVTAYALLRKEGVPIGKSDYLGR